MRAAVVHYPPRTTNPGWNSPKTAKFDRLRQRSPDFDDPVFGQVAGVKKVAPAHRHDVHDILNAKLIAQNFHYALCATKRQALIGRVRALFVSETQDHQNKRG